MKTRRLINGLMLLTAFLTTGSLLGRPTPANDITQGTLRAQSDKGEPLGDFPLKGTDVKAEVSGFVAKVVVTQTYQNPYSDKIEAVYVFPLPQDAAVNDFVMKVGDRTIRGLIKTREDARKIYDDAKKQGHVASLLEQERPNIFTQSVANIEPGKEIEIVLTYVERLKYDHGNYEFVFPMVVGPRYIPGNSTGQPARGLGWSQDTDQVKDVSEDTSRITPPYLKPGERNGHDISLSVNLNAGVPIQNVMSPSHLIEKLILSKQEAVIKLSASDAIPNKDFILKYQVAGTKPQIALIAHRAAKEDYGYFALMIQPQADFNPTEITPKEMVFVVDSSGSMSGEPIAKAKQVVRHALQNMGPGDSFQIIRFSEAASGLSSVPLPNTPENVRQGLSFINGLQGEGGTEMIAGIKAALDYPHDSKRLRIVCFLTDGYIGNEIEVLAAIQDKISGARLFSFGVGSSVNRYLLDEMARVGRGAVHYVRPDEETDPAVALFYECIAHPYLTDIKIDWGNLKVEDLYPGLIPDLFIGQPLIIHGRYSQSGESSITVKGKVAGQTISWTYPLTLPEEENHHEAMASLWARAKIAELEREKFHGRNKDVTQEITALGLKFRLMTAYTSFVAVEEQTVTEDGIARTVQVPVEMPEGVSYDAVFGEGAMLGRGFAPASPAGGILACKRAAPPSMAESRVQHMKKDEAEVKPAEPLRTLDLILVSHNTQGHEIRRIIESDGEVWEVEQDANSQVLHRTLVKKLSLEELRNLQKLLVALSFAEILQTISQDAQVLILQESGQKTLYYSLEGKALSESLQQVLKFF